jgi:PAS domain S-box-containing protein
MTLNGDGTGPLRKAEKTAASLRMLFEAMPIALMAVDDGGVIRAVNAHAQALFGYAECELVGEPLARLTAGVTTARRSGDARVGAVHPWLDAALAGPLLSRSSQGDLHLRACRKDGSEFPIEIGLATGDLGEGPVRLLTLVDLSARKAVEARLMNLTLELAERTTDLELRGAELHAEVEQRRRAEADLQRSHEDFRYLFQRNPLPLWLYSPRSLRFIEVNDAALARYGYTRDEFLTMTVMDLHPRDQLRRVDEVVAEARGKEFLNTHNWKHRKKDGTLIQVDTFSRAFGSGPNAVRLVVAMDVTERNAAEVQLRQAQKMEAVGQLTGGVAHDFNNLLSIILGNLELIQQECSGHAAVRDLVADALVSVQRGASLTQRLLAFSRQQPLEPRVVDTADMIADMAGLLQRSLGEAIRVEHHVAAGLWKTHVDASQMENSLLNLAVNARDAMPRGGKLTIEAQNVVLEGDYAAGGDGVAPGEYVLIAVSDSGIGIAPEVLEHILEPFFTTKPVGKGTGLGLSMVYGFIKQSGGHIRVYSELGVGTTVKLYLPRSQGETETPEQVVPRDALPRSEHGEVVLVVEDDATIRKLVARMLEMLGYRTLTAVDAGSALAALTLAPRVDLLFTDIVLPNGASGAALAVEAQRRHAALKVLYMSGYTRNALANQNMQDESAHLLSKPFRKEELAQAVYRALHG